MEMRSKNLIKNSSEAFESLAPDGRKKTIRIKTFTDNGIGIDREQLDHIFDFGKSYRRSSGFGLYYCKMFVEDNGGMLNVSSSENRPGTTVRVTFKKTGLITGLQIKC